MPTSPQLKVRVTDERYVYSVQSEKNPKKWYRVDMVANGGAGQCECPNFRTVKQQAIDQGAAPCTTFSRCKHLKAVHEYFLPEILKTLASVEGGGI